jgi:hypothetical protein
MSKKILIKAKSKSYPKFEFHCKALKLPTLVGEHKFHPDRRWRFDYCFPELMIAVEFEGGLWIDPNNSPAAHNRPIHFIKDMEKYNEAARLGWFVFRFTPTDANNGKAANYLFDVIQELKKKNGK